MKLSLKGLDNTEKSMRRMERGVARMGEYEAFIFSSRPYAYGIETGRHRVSNQLARRAGGAYYMRRAVQDVTSNAERDIAEGLDRVRSPGKWVLRRLAGWARKVARKNAPKRSGRLRRSIQYSVRRKGT